MEFFGNASGGAGTANVQMSAENSGLPLNTPSSLTVWNPGGFPTTTIYDTVISVTPRPTGPGNADPRLAAIFEFDSIKNILGNSSPRKKVLNADYLNPNEQFHTLGASSNTPSATGYIGSRTYSVLGTGLTPNGMAMVGNRSAGGSLGSPGTTLPDNAIVGVASLYPSSSIIPVNSSLGDWTSGPGFNMDGGIVPRADQDFQSLTTPGSDQFSHVVPYFAQFDSVTDGVSTPGTRGYFSPNRQIPSPITLLGSLPSSVTTGWQTLLFSPNPAAGAGHPGLNGIPDHVLLDLFWMPVAEPYPISETFSTAGKININSAIVPFGYIKRQTGLYALLKSTWITALHIGLAETYKSHDRVKSNPNAKTRYQIDALETLKRFDEDVFDLGNIFRSASQICEMWLVPEDPAVSATNVEDFWTNKLLTSDTGREEPYNNLYSRVTTKSNTFTVHYRAQVLRKVPGTAPGVWDESRDRVGSELRGATLIERYLDPNATDIPDYATEPDAVPLGNFYKWRVVSDTLFQP